VIEGLISNIISEHLLNMDEWDLLREGEDGHDGKEKTSEVQDINSNSLVPSLSY
jgi:hypothetical protein